MARNLYLIGFMCSGKSTVGRLVAQRVGMDWVDLDSFIAQRIGLAPAEAFSSHGEDWFRDRETEALASIAITGNTVVSTGGGTVIRPENAVITRASGLVTLLRVSPDEVLARAGSFASRPLLDVPNPREAVLSLLSQRCPIYQACAHIIIDTDGKSPVQVADEVLEVMGSIGG